MLTNEEEFLLRTCFDYVLHKYIPPSCTKKIMAQTAPLGFTIPPRQAIIKKPKDENNILIDRKARLLTELAALENNISLFDYLNPARNHLQSSVTDVPCAVELLQAPKVSRTNINPVEASNALADLIMNIGQNPTKEPYNRPRPTPICNDIVKHANGFFAQLQASREARAGLLTAFCIIPLKPKEDQQNKSTEPPAATEIKQEDETTKRVHPFFPDVVGTQPLQGLMKKQLGEFPNFVKDPPTEEECEENLWLMPDNAIHEHLMKICGSSSDDEFDPDQQLRNMTPLPPFAAQQLQFMNQNRQ